MFDRMPKVAPTSALGAVACFQILGSVFLPLTKLLALPDALADNSLSLILANLDCLYHLNSVFLLTSIILFNTTSLNGQPPPINHSTNSKPRWWNRNVDRQATRPISSNILAWSTKRWLLIANSSYWNANLGFRIPDNKDPHKRCSSECRKT